ncbi:MAG: ABC transporter permease, partial [Gemmatimonadales bacterium]
MVISPGRLREMLKKEFRQMFRDPRMRPIVLVSPVIQVLVFGYAVNTDVRDTRTAVVDYDNTADSRLFVQKLTASGYFKIVEHISDPARFVALLDRCEAVIGLQLPAGFSRDLRSGAGADIQVLVDGTDSNTGTVVQGYVSRIAQAFGSSLSQSGDQPVELSLRAWYNPSLQSRVYNVPGVIGVL